jgi:hypothetical protein
MTGSSREKFTVRLFSYKNADTLIADFEITEGKGAAAELNMIRLLLRIGKV